jgi:hypothetical protein
MHSLFLQDGRDVRWNVSALVHSSKFLQEVYAKAVTDTETLSPPPHKRTRVDESAIVALDNTENQIDHEDSEQTIESRLAATVSSNMFEPFDSKNQKHLIVPIDRNLVLEPSVMHFLQLYYSARKTVVPLWLAQNLPAFDLTRTLDYLGLDVDVVFEKLLPAYESIGVSIGQVLDTLDLYASRVSLALLSPWFDAMEKVTQYRHKEQVQALRDAICAAQQPPTFWTMHALGMITHQYAESTLVPSFLNLNLNSHRESNALEQVRLAVGLGGRSDTHLPRDILQRIRTQYLAPATSNMAFRRAIAPFLRLPGWQHWPGSNDFAPSLDLAFMQSSGTFWSALDTLLPNSYALFSDATFPRAHVVLAGGACVHLVYGAAVPTNDVDLFVTGDTEQDIIVHAKACVRAAYNVYGHANVRIGRFRNIVMIWLRGHAHVLQLVLTKFTGCEELLLQFDLSVCQVGVVFAKENPSAVQLVFTPESLTSLATREVHLSLLGQQALARAKRHVEQINTYRHESDKEVTDAQVFQARLMRRLRKYAARGFSVHIPSMNVNEEDDHADNDAAQANTTPLACEAWTNDDDASSSSSLETMRDAFRAYFRTPDLVVYGGEQDNVDACFAGLHPAQTLGEFRIWSGGANKEDMDGGDAIQEIVPVKVRYLGTPTDDNRTPLNWRPAGSPETALGTPEMVLRRMRQLEYGFPVESTAMCIYTDVFVGRGFGDQYKDFTFRILFQHPELFTMLKDSVKHVQNLTSQGSYFLRDPDTGVLSGRMPVEEEEAEAEAGNQLAPPPPPPPVNAVRNLSTCHFWKKQWNIEHDEVQLKISPKGVTRVFVNLLEVEGKQLDALLDGLATTTNSPNHTRKARLSCSFVVNHSSLSLTLHELHF